MNRRSVDTASTLASARLRSTIPGRLLISSGLVYSRLSQPYSTHFSKLIVVSHQEYLLAFHNGVQEVISTGNLRVEFCDGIYGRVDGTDFAQAADDIVDPKTDTRGNVYETYLTHRISDHFLLKGSYINYDYTWSGSGWQVGAPKLLNSTLFLGFPTYDTAKMFTLGVVAEF
jgi:hypothetical protein